jgi:hypothetical protein
MSSSSSSCRRGRQAARLHGVGGDHRRLGQDQLAQGFEHRLGGQLVAAPGGHHRIDHHRDVGVVGDDLGDHLDVLDAAEHAELEGLHRHVLEHRPGLLGYEIGIDRQDVLDTRGVLHGEGGDDGERVATHAGERQHVGLDAGAAGGVGGGKTRTRGGVRSLRWMVIRGDEDAQF